MSDIKMAPKILIILTSHDKMGDTGKPTGWYLVSDYLRSPSYHFLRPNG